MSQNEKDVCNCPACTIRRVLEGMNKKTTTRVFIKEAWMEILDDEQLKETIEDAAKVEMPPSIDVAILTLTHHLKQYSTMAGFAKEITDMMGSSDAPPFAVESRAKLRKQLKSLIDLL